jgi:hypothetical protein
LEKQHKNTEEDKTYILNVVTEFYKKAVTDFLIGYQFRKIATHLGHHPLMPPIEAFADHIPRIASFWELQLLHTPFPKDQKPFDLITLHHELSIRKGELSRWILLFKETLEEQDQNHLTKMWHEKITHFQAIFLSKLI